ncbi:MAG: LysE family transporter [Bacteroidota bacterium]
MEHSSLYVIFLVAIASFLGALPFGLVNLNVIETTLRKSPKAGTMLSLGATLLEMVHALIAIQCAMIITDSLDSNPYIKGAVLAVFFLLGLFFFFKRQASGDKPKRKLPFKVSDFGRGAFLSLINPQAIPFWLFIVTYFSSHQMLEVHPEVFPEFLIGVGIGKILALLVFVYFSLFIERRMGRVAQGMNKIIGSIFFLLAALQAYQLWG